SLECKRRKIKCDRSQPCAPCTRRGEQAKCQWHVVEPIEKYVTRAEYDELKARFDHLSALVDRLLGQLQTPATALGSSSEAVSTYALGVSSHHHPLMPPPQTYPHAESSSSTAQAPPQAHRSPTSTAAIPKSSPLSLAAITSPFTPPDHAAQSKNCHAQTFILGERLRPGSQVLGDPVTLFPRRHRQFIRRKHTIMIGIQPSLSIRLRRTSAGLAI
ncbi:hypothetical protein AN958_12211, partial [Leucoagaricus sp. SymC.cos]